jgi:MerR family transcriptional regulator, mercuric resistance operon regulatory protein
VVRFVKRAQEHGFNLDEIEELLHLADGKPDDCQTARELVRTELDQLAEKIAELQLPSNAEPTGTGEPSRNVTVT